MVRDPGLPQTNITLTLNALSLRDLGKLFVGLCTQHVQEGSVIDRFHPPRPSTRATFCRTSTQTVRGSEQSRDGARADTSS